MNEVGRQSRQDIFVNFIVAQINEFEAELFRQGFRQGLFADQAFLEANFTEALFARGDFVHDEGQIFSRKGALFHKNCSDVSFLVGHFIHKILPFRKRILWLHTINFVAGLSEGRQFVGGRNIGTYCGIGILPVKEVQRRRDAERILGHASGKSHG
ncbi:MAG: hypothetical protein MZV70_41240 [Desulfobacterales bacterium]|nr:hypothetical protein [Desulfobacterales bacterium]